MLKRASVGRKRNADEPQPDEFSRQIVEKFLTDLKFVCESGAGVPETSFYPALSNLFNAVGETLRPRVRCVMNLRNRGAGLPDGGFFTAEQFERQTDDGLWEGQLPARGAIEVKSTSTNIDAVIESQQVKDYVATYGIVLVTNLREYVIVECDPTGQPRKREAFSLAADEEDFWQNKVAHPRATAQAEGQPFVEFIRRACLQAAPLVDPRDVAWFLASYARDALFRVQRHKDLPALQAVRNALEESLGMKFTGEKGEHFFHSTLVQTLFYGVFSAWVSWHKDNPPPGTKFDWQKAEWSLHVPFIRTLYEEVAKPSRLGPLGLVEVLDWTAAVLNRVDRESFFRRFEEEQAVQYFYEPFLQAYDPELRKALGVWYTPPEIVKYQVARVDRVLREELDIADGLADPNVIVLDPCCGTGAYLVEVLRTIAATLREKGGDALVASDLKQAAMHRVFGFEIMPAPFVVAHLQLGLMLQSQGAPLIHQKQERVGVYLTNALTGWERPKGPKQRLFAWAELEEERDAAEQIKCEKKILVVLGNPPYNAFAGVSPEEEQGLVEPYKEGLNKPEAEGGWGIKKFNLDDLYVRFFRVAERRIAEMTGRGVVSFISNHSWISEPSFVVLRKHLLESFDKFWIENLHGNRKISEYAPDGRTSETIFAIRGFSVGIQQGVATSLWVKTGKARKGLAQVLFRDDINDARAEDRRKHLLQTLKRKRLDAAYTRAKPCPENRYSFRPENVARQYMQWPRVVELCAVRPMNGLMEKRGGALIDIDRHALEARMRDYFNPSLSWDDYKKRHWALTMRAAGFDPQNARQKALRLELFNVANVQRYAVRPFDTRWCYYTALNPLWNRSRPKLYKQIFKENAFLMTRPSGVAVPEGVPFSFTRCLGDNDYQRGHAYYFPLLLSSQPRDEKERRCLEFESYSANLSKKAREYLAGLCIKDPDADVKMAGMIWMHALAVGYSPAYLAENADGIRRDWPRIPLPQSREALEASAELGERIAALLDTEADVAGVTSGKISPLLRTIGVISRVDGGAINPDAGDLELTAGWGHGGKGGVVMPAKGKVVRRAYSEKEIKAMEAEVAALGLSLKELRRLLGEQTLDVYLNNVAYWCNVPVKVWDYYIGGYQVIKKWLSYRERELLGRALTPEEAREVTNIARRLTAIILLQPKLDENYRNVKAAAIDWRASDS